MNILFTICARAGSKGVKNKNIRSFLGIPLVYYTLAAYQLYVEKYKNKYKQIDIAVNTDSLALINQINKTNIEYLYIKRKDELSGDTISKPDVIKDTVWQTENIKNIKYDIIVDLDLTSPIRAVGDIYKIIESIVADPNIDVTFSMAHARRTPFFNQVCQKESGFYNTVIQSQYVTRQEAPICYDMNASIYGYKRNFILAKETKRVFDGRAMGVLVKDTAVLDIDGEEDMELMEVLASYFFNTHTAYGEINFRASNL